MEGFVPVNPSPWHTHMYGLSVQKVYASELKGTGNLEKDSLIAKTCVISGSCRESGSLGDGEPRITDEGAAETKPGWSTYAGHRNYREEMWLLDGTVRYKL